jgi:hypothetical protein
MLAHARSVLKREHNLSNHETANIHAFLQTLKERQLSSRTHKSPPPKYSTLTPRARPLQDLTIPRPTLNPPSHITKKRRTHNKSSLHPAHASQRYDPSSNHVGNKRMTERTRTNLATILTKQQQKKFQKLLLPKDNRFILKLSRKPKMTI